jgi:ATPase subunit of ABC transporter with duplicated ATPase domains
MSASITTFDLGWSIPEGRPVFSSLSLSFNADRVGIVGRNGVGATGFFSHISLGSFQALIA